MTDKCGQAKCGWCGADMGAREGLSEGQVTHGMCPPCFEREIKQIYIDPPFGVKEGRKEDADN